MQALTTLFKMVFYNGGSIFLASVLFTFTNSTFFQDFWASRFEIIGCDLSIAKAFGACLVFIGFISLLEEAFEVRCLPSIFQSAFRVLLP